MEENKKIIVSFDNVEQWCKIFHNREGREIFYKYATKCLSDGSFEKKIDGISLIILGWNYRYYQRQNKKFDRKEIENLIKNREILPKERIETIDLEDKKGKIKELFNQFEKVLGPTGASKALHLLNPKLFVMWDSKIRTNYNSYDKSGSYFKFLLKEQKKVKGLIIDFRNKFNLDGKKDEEVVDEIINMLNKGFEYRREITKLIDEYNYASKWFNKK